MGQVTVNGSVAQSSCKQSIHKDLWDVKGNRAKGKSKESRDINLVYCIPLKHIVTTAHYNGKIARNPFAEYKVAPDHKERGFLTEDELQALTTVELNNPDFEL